MKLDEALQQQVKSAVPESKEDIYYMIGGLASDPDKNVFRFFPDPENTRSYLLINKSDVLDEVYQLTELESTRKGFVNENTFRIAVKHGTKVRSVLVTIETIGETISAETTADQGTKGKCKYTSGCNSQCCTYGSDGKCYCDTCCIA